MNLDYNVIFTGLMAPVALLLVRTLLDLSIAHYFVKYFWWVPVRSLFRDHPPDLSGKWEQSWGAGVSKRFGDPIDRHSYTTIRQFGKYVYAEYDSKGQVYVFFGRIQGLYVIAEWYDKSDKYAYFGAAQLRIIDAKTLEGLYVGHSHRDNKVGSAEWDWKKH
jgi:hypothetical protein